MKALIKITGPELTCIAGVCPACCMRRMLISHSTPLPGFSKTRGRQIGIKLCLYKRFNGIEVLFDTCDVYVALLLVVDLKKSP